MSANLAAFPRSNALWSRGFGGVKTVALAVVVVAMSACAPPCRTVCRKTLRCGVDSERVSQEECELSCNRQLGLYQQWEDKVKLAAFRKHRNCIFNSSCEEISDGVCYDDELFEFDGEQSDFDTEE